MFWKEPIIWIFLDGGKKMIGLVCYHFDAAYNKNLRVGENYSCTTGVFYREFSFSGLASDSA